MHESAPFRQKILEGADVEEYQAFNFRLLSICFRHEQSQPTATKGRLVGRIPDFSKFEEEMTHGKRVWGHPEKGHL